MPPDTSRPIAVLLYPGCALLDVALPLRRLGEGPCRVTTVAARIRPLPSSGPIRLLAERTFEELPAPSALIIPGGGAPTVAALADRQLIAYVQAAAAQAGLVAAIGTGTLVLATAGLLVDRTATTVPAFAEALRELGGRYVPDVLVADGPILTALDAHPLSDALYARLQGDPA